MVWTIAPAVSGRERRRILGIHSAGLLAGAVTMMCVLLLIGGALRVTGVTGATGGSLVQFATAVVLVGWALQAAGGPGLPFPRSRWQVPEDWRATLPLPATGLFYGFLLGLGPLTDVILPAYWLLVGATLASDNVLVAAVAWVVYAGVRALVTIGGVREYSTSCALDGSPSTQIRPAYERTVVRMATIGLLLTVAAVFVPASV
jgi:hypothetical protein